MLESSGVVEASDESLAHLSRVVRVPLLLSSRNVSESARDPYAQALNVEVAVGGRTYTERLFVELSVSAAAVASRSTYVAPPTPPPPAPPIHPPDQATTMPCVCENTCAEAPWDGTCDDGGPGHQYGGCALGTDCADCGPRAGPMEAFRVENSLDATERAALLESLAAELVASQLLLCVPEHADTVCPSERNCTNLGLHGTPATALLQPVLPSSYCHERDAYDWIGAADLAGAQQQCRATYERAPLEPLVARHA